ncbi:MAG: outer membrane beta-barrel protein [Prevotella sp.]|nr:outer membrane beta-barrel protein [Prevotella sp.]
MKQQDWTEQLSQRMDSYEEPVPADLWQDVDRRLHPVARRVALRRWLAGAAAVALLAGGGWMIWGGGEPAPVDDVVAQAEPSTMASTAAPSTQPSAQPALMADNSPAPVASHLHEPVRPLTTENEDMKTTVEPVQETPAMTPAEEQTKPAEAVKTPPASSHVRIKETETARPAVIRRRAFRPSISINAGHLLAAGDAGSIEPLRMSPSYMGPVTSALARSGPVYLSNSIEETTHHAPLTFGLSLRMPLSAAWWLESGLNYSYVASTFTHRYGTRVTSEKQQLHYLGVPLSVGYNVWNTRRLQTYAAAGVEGMVNMAAHVSEGHVSRDRLQMAVGVSVGAVYELLPATSIYVQPSLRYYPDNGSSLRNVFKDRQLQFDLRMGLRYNFGRNK